MKNFKFFGKNKLSPIRTPRGRHDFLDYGTLFRYTDGTYILTTEEVHAHRLSEIKHGNYNPFSFWWQWNYEEFENENERTTGDYELNLYEGPISLFQETYQRIRRRGDVDGFFPRMPVITHIKCNGHLFYNSNLKFNNDYMWVEISYKKFL